MRQLLPILAMVSLPLSAAAQADDVPPDDAPAMTTPQVGDRGYVALGWETLLDAADSAAGSVSVEGGYRIPDSAILLHGLVGDGDHRDGGADTRGPSRELRFGIEADTCSAGRMACAFVGADAGHRWSSATTRDTNMTTDTSGGLFVARAGFDAGNAVLRVRLDLEYTGDAAGFQLALVHRFY